LKNNTSIRDIRLEGNNISDKGAEKLVDVLESNNVLEGFMLDDNPISDLLKKRMGGIQSKREVESLKTIIAEKDAVIAARDEEMANMKAEMARILGQIDSLKLNVESLVSGTSRPSNSKVQFAGVDI